MKPLLIFLAAVIVLNDPTLIAKCRCKNKNKQAENVLIST